MTTHEVYRIMYRNLDSVICCVSRSDAEDSENTLFLSELCAVEVCDAYLLLRKIISLSRSGGSCSATSHCLLSTCLRDEMGGQTSVSCVPPPVRCAHHDCLDEPPPFAFLLFLSCCFACCVFLRGAAMDFFFPNQCCRLPHPPLCELRDVGRLPTSSTLNVCHRMWTTNTNVCGESNVRDDA